MRKLAILSILLTTSCIDFDDWRCHEGYTRVEYNEAYTSTESICISRDRYSNCTAHMYYPQHHSAKCLVSFECTTRCWQINEGKSEAHPKHETIVTKPFVDDKCTPQGEIK